MKKLIYYATGNMGKFESVKLFFANYPDFDVRQYDVDLPEEQTMDQQAIALAKARLAWEVLKQPVLVDDGGMYFHKYNQFPGTMTKFVYQGLGVEGIYKLFDEGDSASFIVSTVYMYGPSQHKMFMHESKGFLTKSRLGQPEANLPFEHIFIPAGYDKTYRELKQTSDYQNFNPRILALKQFVDYSISDL